MSFVSRHPLPFRIASGTLWFSLTMIGIVAALALAGSAISVFVGGLWRMLTGA